MGGENRLPNLVRSPPPTGEALSLGTREREEQERGDSEGGSSVFGQRHDGPVEEQRLIELGSRILPPFPGRQYVQLAVVPQPPLLDADLPGVELVAWLAKMYREAIRRRFNKPSWFMAQGDITKHKAFGLLLAAAQAMIVSKIPPAAWVLWSIDSWAKMTRSDSPPSVAFTFASSRLEQQVTWFEENQAAYSGGAIQFGKLHVALTADWEAMWAELMRERPTTRDAFWQIVERHFPGGSYEERLANVVREAKALQRELDTAVKEGLVLW